MLVCYSETRGCPCRLVDLDSDISFCNFAEMFSDILIKDDESAKKDLLKKVCDDIRNEVLYHDYRAADLQKRAKEFLSQVNIGDEVYCIAEDRDVVFLEYPRYKYGDCKYRTVDGKVKKNSPFLFSIISKGHKCGEYKTKNRDKADLYAFKARKCGFRVERKKTENSYVLIIFGDTQKEVDSFITALRSNN